jgi:ATP-dependent Zn protease
METAAYHEAGHAVIASILGGKVVSVSIESESPEVDGDAVVAWTRGGRTDRAIAVDDIRVALAGPIAEMVYAGEYDYLRIRGEHAVDWQIAMSSLRRLGLSTDREAAVLQQTVAELYQTIRQDNVWSSIGDVADLLAVHETIEGDVVDDTVRFWLNR